MSNLNLSKRHALALLACLCALPTVSMSQPDTLRGYIDAQRAALTATNQPLVPAASKPGAIPIIETKTVPEAKGTASESKAPAPLPVEAFVPPPLRVLGILTQPGQSPKVSVISESGGAEWLLSVGESAPNSAWRVASITANTPTSHVVRFEANALPLPPPKSCKPEKNKPCTFTPSTPHSLVVTL